MLPNIVGSFFILIGLYFMLKPEGLKRRLRNKALRRLRWYSFVVTFSLSALLISTGWRYEGLLPKFLAIMAIIVIIKCLFFLKARTAEHLTQWLLRRPLVFFRLCAIGHIALGLTIILGLKH